MPIPTGQAAGADLEVAPGTEGRAPFLRRRQFITGMVTGAAAAVVASRVPRAWAGAPAEPPPYPFTLGVASGDPRPGAVALWTRLAPDPFGDGGMPAHDVPVRWEVAEDEGFGRVVRHGVVAATAGTAHSVHVDVEGLAPGRWYWYRFLALGESSATGRTRTLPEPGAAPERLRFAVASCQHYEHGYYTAYRHMAAEDLDLVLHLGDYIYEHAPGGAKVPGGPVRAHAGGEPWTLAEYRQRFAQYRTDPDLQAAHAAFPFVVTWDDHEVVNNYASAVGRGDEDPAVFAARRAAAYRAYWEHMPLAAGRVPWGPSLPMHRRLTVGNLARFHVLDTRQHRSDQPCPERKPVDCPERHGPERTMTGRPQEEWLYRGLRRGGVRWNVLAQQVFLAQVDVLAGPERGYNVDAWDGATAARRRLLGWLADRSVANPVVLTGDAHTNWVADLRLDFDDPAAPVIGSEFVATSISSGGDGSDTHEFSRVVMAENPHVRFANHQRGYIRCEVTPQRWRTDFRVVPYVSRPGAPVTTRASFVIEDRASGALLD